MKQPQHIILFDGPCNLCNAAVRSIIKKDSKNKFRFASLQSDAGVALLKRLGLPEEHSDSVVYIKNGDFFLGSDAALEIAKTLGGKWQLFYIFKIIPRVIRNGIYNFIARNRYKWFGKQEVCALPAPQLSEKFL